MTRAADHTRHPATAPGPGVLRLVAMLIAMVFAQVLPALRRRPDLALPLLAALRGLAVAAWGCRRLGAGPVPAARLDALRAAVLRLRGVLEAVAADEGWEDMAPAHACVRGEARRAVAALPVIRDGLRRALARDGPCVPPA